MDSLTPGPTVAREVEEASNIDESAFRERFEALDRPLVVRGGARDFPAFERWSPEYLRRAVGSVRVHHKLSVTNKHPDFEQPSLAVSFARG